MDISEAVKKINELAKQYPDEVYAESEKALDLIVSVFENAVIPLTPKGVGGQAGLVGSIFGETQKQKGKLIGIVGTPLQYGEVIEYGRQPGKMPPVNPIALWAEKKLGVDRNKSKGVAYVIAKNIARRGFKSIPDGARMFEKGWENSERTIQTIISGIPQKVLDSVS